MIIVSEDNPGMSVSRMLSKGLVIKFAGGNKKITTFNAELNNLRDTIIFFDYTVAHGNSLRQFYNNLRRDIVGVESSYVYPIPCIEYFVLESLEVLSEGLERQALSEHEYDRITDCKLTYKPMHYFLHYLWKLVKLNIGIKWRTSGSKYNPYSIKDTDTRTMEHSCKAILHSCENKSLHNVNVDLSALPGVGSYYEGDLSDFLFYIKLRVLANHLPVVIEKQPFHSDIGFPEDLKEHNNEYVWEYDEWISNHILIDLPDVSIYLSDKVEWVKRMEDIIQFYLAKGRKDFRGNVIAKV